MTKNDNKELHSILEQLKKSYSSVDEDILDNPDSSDNNDADEANDDFQKLLTNFFSTDFVDEKNQDTYHFNIMEEKKEYPEDIPDETLSEEMQLESEESDEELTQNDETVEILEDPVAEEIIEDSIDDEPVNEDIVEVKYDDVFEEEIVNEPVLEEEIIEETIEDAIEESIQEVQEESDIEDNVSVEYAQEEIIEDDYIDETVEDDIISEEEITDNIEDDSDTHQNEENIQKTIPIITENILLEPIDKVKRDEVTAVENVFRIMFGARQDTDRVTAEEKQDVADSSDYNFEDEELVDSVVEVVAENVEYSPIAEDIDDQAEDVFYNEASNEESVEAIEEIGEIEEAEYFTDDSIEYQEPEEDVNGNVEIQEDIYVDEPLAEEPQYVEEYNDDEFEEYEEPDLSYYLEEIQPVVVNDEPKTQVEETFEYSYDPLQGHLSDAAYVVHKSVDDKLNFKPRQRDIALDDDDISLLLDFGYDDEIKTEAGANRTNQIKRQKQVAITPEKSERIPGYSGEEYLSDTQNKSIKKKYVHDKRKIVVRIAMVAVLAVVMLGLSIIYWMDTTVDHLTYPYIEVIALILTAAIAAPGLLEGARGIARLDPKTYSVSAYLLIIQFIYDLFIILLQINSNVISDDRVITCGFIVIIYVMIALISDALECNAEAIAFDVVSSDGRLYSAEKFNKPKTDMSEKSSRGTVSSGDVMLGNNIYKVKETDIANGYFARISKKQGKCLRVMYFMGIVPVVALIAGCITLLLNDNAYVALSSVMTVILMGFPMSFTLFKAIPYYKTSKHLAAINCAMVGEVSYEECAHIDTIMFDDVDSVTITESIEIRPEGNADITSAIKVASRAFKSLGGPLSRIVATDITEPNADINIVSIRDNGIEFYMDSYLHVVIGDKNFMAINGMKVSSDTKITATSTDNKSVAVLYVAFNGVPQLGYIVSSKVKEEFTKTIKALSTVGIKTAVATYSPAINDYYFEANRPVGVPAAIVYKPASFEAKDKTHFVDGGAYAVGEPTKIAYAIIEAKNYLKVEVQNKRFSTLMAILGIIMGIACIALVLIPYSDMKIGILSCVLIMIFNAASIFGICFKYIDFKKKLRRK